MYACMQYACVTLCMYAQPKFYCKYIALLHIFIHHNILFTLIIHYYTELDVMAGSESLTSPLDMSPSEEVPSPKRNKYSFPVNSLETMQRSVMNAFALKYSKCECIVVAYHKPSLNKCHTFHRQNFALYGTCLLYNKKFLEIHQSLTFWK